MSLMRKLSPLIRKGKKDDVLLPVIEGSFLPLLNQCL